MPAASSASAAPVPSPPGSPPPRTRLPRVSDATLRDSAHMAGVEFSPPGAAAVAVLLRRVGIDLVETGFLTGAHCADAPLVEAVHEAVGPGHCVSLVAVRSRAQVVTALDEALRLGCRSVMLSLPTSAEHAGLKLGSPSLRRLMTLARVAIGEAKDRRLHVTFSGEDAARTPLDRLTEYVASGFAAGADRFRLAETVSSLTPWSCGELVAALRKDACRDATDEVEVHCHNMLGMAVGNSLAAHAAGADWISVTTAGIGERGGNTPLAELLCSLRVLYDDDRHALEHLPELTAEVHRRAGLDQPFVSGPATDRAFAYEILGQLTHPAAYESIAPEQVGNHRTLRVRTRFGPPLLTWALGDAADGLDVDAYCAWLRAHQERHGRPALDRDGIRRLAETFKAASGTGGAPPNAPAAHATAPRAGLS
ncbi:isopropylmalate synthase [Streptomyces sp. NPDC053474]|uniref:isopropylmalate synthase n=1 Tax=Streptomyces sp. NPDC053474 TaxID=3365704 RepID=UPI0037D98404